MLALLFTTCDLASGRLDEFQRLTASLEEAAQRTAGPRFTHVVLMQRATPEALSPFAQNPRGYARVLLHVPHRLSLAAARNAMLRTAQSRGLLSTADWIAFPDDDAWYPQGLMQQVSAVFEARPEVTLVTSRYGSAPLPSLAASDFATCADMNVLVPVLSSNTLFLRLSAVLKAGVYFDERLGLGARINGGEDLDYALRALATGGSTAYCPEARVGHRDRMDWVRSKYFEGSLCALARGAALDGRLVRAAWRKRAVGLALALKRELPWTRYVEGLRLAADFARKPGLVEAQPGVLDGLCTLPASAAASTP